MQITNPDSARELGSQLAYKIIANPASAAYSVLSPILAEKIPFRLLDMVGEALVECPAPKLEFFLNEIAAHGTLGGWTVIASALRSRIPQDMGKVVDLARGFIIQADAWYACDCIGERVLGQALVNEFETALKIFSPWRVDPNRWVRRSVGVAGHFWAKRSRGTPELSAKAKDLMMFYEPMLAENQIDAAKGTGWALKTLGRYYPHELSEFLNRNKSRKISSVIVRKALKFLPEEMKEANSR